MAAATFCSTTNMTGTSKAIPTADEIVRLLDLEPHPEGGRYRETFRDTATVASAPIRPAPPPPPSISCSPPARYRAGTGSTPSEVWHWYAGAPLALTLATRGGRREIRLGPDLAAGERPQAVVPAGAWQQAAKPGRLDAGRLHGGARLRVCRLRAGAAGLRALSRRGRVHFRRTSSLEGELSTAAAMRRCGSNRCFPELCSA